MMIYLNDHRPAHVHVTGADCEAVFILNCPDGPPELREVYGHFNRRKLGRIQNDLAECVFALCQKWSEIHDRY